MLLTCQTLYLLLQIVNQAMIIVAPNNLDLAIGDICEPIRPVRTATVLNISRASTPYPYQPIVNKLNYNNVIKIIM